MKNKVEQFRREMGLTQEQLARMLRVSRQTVWAVETGKYTPSLDLAFAMSLLFRRPIEEIFFPERSENQ